jgi:predicted nucleic acid-binding protein
MSAGAERLFLDTVFVQALLNRRDQYHARAREFAPRPRAAAAVWITEAILVEVGNALGTLNRAGAVAFIEECYRTPNIRVVAVDTALLSRATRLYGARGDKEWGLPTVSPLSSCRTSGFTTPSPRIAIFNRPAPTPCCSTSRDRAAAYRPPARCSTPAASCANRHGSWCVIPCQTGVRGSAGSHVVGLPRRAVRLRLCRGVLPTPGGTASAPRQPRRLDPGRARA